MLSPSTLARSIQVNASITAATGAFPGTIGLNANNPNLNQPSSLNLTSNSDTNGITGSGHLLARGRDKPECQWRPEWPLSGSISTQAQPLQLTSDTGQLSLAIRTWNGNACAFVPPWAFRSTTTTPPSARFKASILASSLPKAAAAAGINTAGSNGSLRPGCRSPLPAPSPRHSASSPATLP